MYLYLYLLLYPPHACICVSVYSVCVCACIEPYYLLGNWSKFNTCCKYRISIKTLVKNIRGLQHRQEKTKTKNIYKKKSNNNLYLIHRSISHMAPHPRKNKKKFLWARLLIMIINFYAARNKTECKARYEWEKEKEKERGKLNKKVSQTPTHALTEMRWQYRQTGRDIERARETHAKWIKLNWKL